MIKISSLVCLFAFLACAEEVQVTDLQTALDQAAPGDVLLLQPGGTYRGNFKIPAKVDGPPITIRTDAPLSESRIAPGTALARIVSPNTAPALEFLPNADNYRIVGVEITVDSGIYSNDVIRVGSLAATRIEDQPDNIEFDRIYVHGDPVVGSKRGVMLSTNRVTIRRSYMSDFKAKGQDAMAIAVCNALGPVDVSDSYLEASGYPIIFGGCNNRIPEIVPSGAFTGNLVSRPVSWQAEGWTVKNLFEVKLGRGIRIDGNVFENNWASAQVGFAILMEAVPNGLNPDGTRFAVADDITFRNNIVRNSPHGLNLGSTNGLQVENNLFVGVTGRLFQMLGTMQGVQFRFNTALDVENTALVSGSTAQINGFVLRGNILNLGRYGIKGSGVGTGNATLTAHYPGSVVDSNVFIGGRSSLYPEGNHFVATVEELGLSDYALPDGSPFKGIVDGADPGWQPVAVEPLPEPEPEPEPDMVTRAELNAAIKELRDSSALTKEQLQSEIEALRASSLTKDQLRKLVEQLLSVIE